MNRQKVECQSCETKFTITVTDSNYENLDEVEINYCPSCSAEFDEDDDDDGFEDD